MHIHFDSDRMNVSTCWDSIYLKLRHSLLTFGMHWRSMCSYRPGNKGIICDGTLYVDL
jgi:hypothetical protein